MTVPAVAHRALILLALVLPGWAQAGTLKIVSANYQHGAKQLVVVTRAQDTSGVLLLLHDQGGILAKVTASAGVTQDKQRFKIPLAQLGAVPCQVEVRLGDLTTTKKVSGAPAACRQAPCARSPRPVPVRRSRSTPMSNSPLKRGSRTKKPNP